MITLNNIPETLLQKLKKKSHHFRRHLLKIFLEIMVWSHRQHVLISTSNCPPYNLEMASVEGDELSEEFSFLDLQNCSPKTKSFLLSLIEDEEKPKKVSNPVTTVIEEARGPPTSATSALAHHQQVQQQQHFTHQQIYPTPPTSPPWTVRPTRNQNCRAWEYKQCWEASNHP